jgi:hypothetical protein
MIIKPPEQQQKVYRKLTPYKERLERGINWKIFTDKHKENINQMTESSIER